MKEILMLLSLIGVAGCASGPGLQARMGAFVGASEQTLVQDLGVPDKQIAVGGVTYLAYVRVQSQMVPEGFVGVYGGPYWGPYDGPVMMAPLPEQVQSWNCEITFVVKDGKVAGVGFRGNDCQ
jgi:hypothetical protein